MSRSATILLALALFGGSSSGDPVGAEETRWIAIGGGAEPASTQVSLEQDIELARAVFGPGGRVLFAGGPGAFGVQVLQSGGENDSLRRELGDLFDPRDGRDATYRLPRIVPDARATREVVLDTLEKAARQAGEALLIYVAAHGEQGETPRNNSIQLWGGGALAVSELGAALDATAGPRTVRLVVSACFSGGFAELAFAAADPEAGSAPTVRCGLFASRWDEESSGCDPNPDRRAQEGYGLHFLHALEGNGRDGRRLDSAEVDLDGDGRISLLEAHTRARIASASLGVPTTTSERWLRHALPRREAEKAVRLPEEDAVIAALGRALDLPTEAAGAAELTRIEAEVAVLDEKAKERRHAEEERFAAVRIALLERWPVLDDPWHPDFESTLRRDGKAIRSFIRDGRQGFRYRAARDDLDDAYEEIDRLRLRASRVGRLVRAHETRRLAGLLHAAGGEAWEYYRRLLECERGPVRVAQRQPIGS
jgi:hypothetical protein